MKKLKLGASVFQKEEALTRSQLKKVLGGDGSNANGKCLVYCRNSSGVQVGDDKEVSSCEPPLGTTMDNACYGVSGYVRDRSTCTC